MKKLLLLAIGLLSLNVQSSSEEEKPINNPQQTIIGSVTVVEDEIEIEYVDPTIWKQWVFSSDETTVEYMIFAEDGSIEYVTMPLLQEQI